MFLAGDYDAMVNYECLIIDADRKLTESGKEPLYAVYPYDGLSIVDSPLGYLDHGDSGKEQAFLKVQDYLLSDEAQIAIEATGRRISLKSVSEQNKPVFNAEWGIDTDRILSPITMPSADVLMNALNLWQSSFRKPSLTVYCLDYSGSMSGEGNAQLVNAMSQVLLQENAERNLLQAGTGDINVVVTFDSHVLNVYSCENSEPDELVCIDTNKYGLSPELHDETVQAKIFYDKIEFYYDHDLVASYRCCYGKNEELMDWTQYVRTLCRKPGAAEHTRFFSAMPLPWQSYLSQTRGQERKSALQLLDDIVRDGNAEFCVDILTLAQQNGRSDVDSVKQCYYSLLKEGKTPEPLDLLSQVPTLNYNPDISVYDGLTGGEANG